MKNIIKSILIAIGVAVVALSLTFINSLNLIWILAIVMFALDQEVSAFFISVLGGFIFDVMLKGDVGSTGLAVIVGLLLFTLSKSLRLSEKTIAKVINIVVVNIVVVTSSLLIKQLLDAGLNLNLDVLVNILKTSLANSLLSVALFFIIRNLFIDQNSDKTVKV